MKRIMNFLILICLIFSGCTTNEKNTNEETKIDDNKNLKKEKLAPTKKKSSKKDKIVIDQILPYSNPKTINEILESVYIVDTLFRKTVQNDIGNDDDEFLMVFNEIIGKVNSIEERPNQISAMKKIEYFDPVFIRKNGNLIVPFHSDSERENTIFTIWAKKGNEFEYKDYIQKLFLTKYSRIRVIDEFTKDKMTYLLMEEYSPDEAEMNRYLSLGKLTSKNELSIIKSYQLGIIETDSIIPKCYLKYENSNLSIIQEVNLSLNNSDKLNLIDELKI